MSAEKKIDNKQTLPPIILGGAMGFMMICAWAFAGPNAFKRPTIDVQLTENVDSQTKEIQATETTDTETTTSTKEPESSTTTTETTDTETTTTATTTAQQSEVNTETTSSSEQPITDTTETTTNTETPEPIDISQPDTETTTATTDIATTSQSQGKSLTQPKTLGQVKFDLNEVSLSSPAEQTINSLISEIKEYDPNKVAIQVEGHTSRVGETQVNQLISQDRANAVVEYLKEQNLPHQVIGKGMGYSQPLPGSDPAADVNQRTVIILTPAN